MCRSPRRSSSPATRGSARKSREVTLIPADKALEEFRNYSGFGAALDALKDNPLPHVLHVRAAARVPARPGGARVATALFRRLAGSRHRSDRYRVGACASTPFSTVLRRLLVIAAALLGRRSAGGDRQHHPAGDPQPPRGNRGHEARRRLQRVRAPAIPLHRVLYGLGGAVLAWAILEAAVLVLDQPVATLAQLYGSRYRCRGRRVRCWVAASVAAWCSGGSGRGSLPRRHLRSIEPRA